MGRDDGARDMELDGQQLNGSERIAADEAEGYSPVM
jgi:hypothetical protein